MLEQPEQTAYLIVDEAHTEMPAMPLIKFLDGYETVAEIEEALGILAGNLAATLQRYNEFAAKGEDPDFHKQPEYCAAQDTGPYAVFDLSLGRAMYSGFTMGGLATTVDGAVQRADGTVIPWLYAAGACASNIAQDGKGYSSGTQLGRARSSVAGRVRRSGCGGVGLTPKSTCGTATIRRPAPVGCPAAIRLAEQPQLLLVVLVHGAAMGDADQDAVRHPGAAAGRGRTPVLVERRGGLVKKYRLRFGQQHPGEGDALLLTRESTLPSRRPVEPAGQLAQRDVVEGGDQPRRR